MFCLDDTDVLEAWASVDAKIDCIIDGLVSGVFKNLYTGTLSNAANTHVYVAGTDVAVVSASFVNTHNAPVTVSFKKDPANGGNPKWIVPVDVSLGAGCELLFDGQKSQVMDTSGQILNTFPLPLSAEKGGTGLTSYTVGDLLYASGATTLSKLADVAVGSYLASGGIGVAPAWATLNQAAVAGLTTGSSPVFVTVKLSGLTDGYIPYHVADATGLADSPIWTDATLVGLGTATPSELLSLVGGSILISSTTNDPFNPLTGTGANNRLILSYHSADDQGLISAREGGANAYKSLGLGIGTGTQLFLNNNGGVGINTTTIPHGGVGMAKFAIDGTNNSAAGPHVQFTTALDDYPVMQMRNWSHDNIELLFDAYLKSDGSAWLSSDAGSNFSIWKNADKLSFQYDSGIAQGAVITWNYGIILNLSGGVFLPNIKSGINQGAAGAAVGELWFDTDDDNTVKMGV